MPVFSLHARVVARLNERQRLERLCRHIFRPAMSEKRLSLTTLGNVATVDTLQGRPTPVIFESLDSTARLVHLCPIASTVLW